MEKSVKNYNIIWNFAIICLSIGLTDQRTHITQIDWLPAYISSRTASIVEMITRANSPHLSQFSGQAFKPRMAIVATFWGYGQDKLRIRKFCQLCPKFSITNESVGRFRNSIHLMRFCRIRTLNFSPQSL